MPRMTPSEAFVETLVAQGVTEIYGIMGSAFMAVSYTHLTLPTILLV